MDEDEALYELAGAIVELKDRVGILKVVSQAMKLTKKGRNYMGECPFHQDKNPSLSVNEDIGIYKCFSCGAAGDSIKFIMEYWNVDFKSALAGLKRLDNG